MKHPGNRSTSVVGPIRYGTGPSPIGPILLATSDLGICGISVLIDQSDVEALARMRAHYPSAEMVEDQLAVASYFPRVAAYLLGADDCSDLVIDMRSGTPFQQQVWKHLRSIPRGTTQTYGEVADEVGRPRAARAVGTACGLNPVSLIVPCHRVVGAGGSLGGYGWGLARKQALLDLEQH